MASKRLKTWLCWLAWCIAIASMVVGAAYSVIGLYVMSSCGHSFLDTPPGFPTSLEFPPARQISGSKPFIIGHSGSAHCCPRNTLECLQTSLRLGATMLEIDLRTSKDGRLVAFHDGDVAQQTKGRGAVRSLTLRQLQKLSVSFDSSAAEREGHIASLDRRTFRIASFSQIRRALPSVPLLLDIKEDGVVMKSALASLVRSFDAHDFARIFIKTRSQALADYLRRLPQPPQVALTLCERVAVVAFPGVGRFAPGLLDLPRWLVSPNLLRRAVRDGHTVVVSTVNTPKRLQQVLALPGLFGIVTDRPDLLHQLQRRLFSKRNHPDLRPVVRIVSLEHSKPGRNDTRTPGERRSFDD